MTKTETAQLLTLITAFDHRTIGETDVEAWHLIVADLEPNDCMEAVREHYLTERDWLMPADVRRRALAASRRREGQRRNAEREAEIAAENPTAELTMRERPLLALVAGSPLKSVPRRSWTERHGYVPAASKPSFTDEELAAAKAELDAARPDAS